jgi:adenine-specific DNA methylase
MKLLEQATPGKLRGSYYTPPFLVRACFGRLAELAPARQNLKVLEPAAGDGAFLQHMPADLPWAVDFRCIEATAAEAVKCAAALGRAELRGTVHCESFFAWAKDCEETFDAVVGNPPFVRYQYVSRSVRSDADRVLARRGQAFDRVANLWIPFVLASLARLRRAGAFALVLPAELFAIKSAGLVRQHLLTRFADLTLDLYPRENFPETLQDVIVVSGRAASPAPQRRVTLVDHASGRTWQHRFPASHDSWTRFLLTARERGALAWVAGRPYFGPLGRLAALGVAIVTGANAYFTVDRATVDQYRLQPWARPLLPRTAECPGLVYTPQDHRRTAQAGKRAWLLDFAADRPDPREFLHPARYLKLGERLGLPTRFKCRIRAPWYHVPGAVAGQLMLPKRCHRFHRLLHNQAGVLTTDTIYRGAMKPAYRRRRYDLVAGFHNSATLLSAEVEGRKYGGGVLELVPSEVARLAVPLLPVGQHLRELDALSRTNGGQADKDDHLVEATNALVVDCRPELRGAFEILEAARQRLRHWRFER